MGRGSGLTLKNVPLYSSPLTLKFPRGFDKSGSRLLVAFLEPFRSLPSTVIQLSS